MSVSHSAEATVSADDVEMLLRLMPEHLWDKEAAELWKYGIDSWRQVMLSPEATGGGETNFYEEQLEASEGMFKLAVLILSRAKRVQRDDNLEDIILKDAYNSFFPDEYFIGTHQLDEAFQKLILDPAGLVIEQQAAKGKTGVSPAYVTGFSSPHRADIGDYAATEAAALISQLAKDATLIPRVQAIAIAKMAADAALPQLLEFVGSGELDLNTGRPNEVIRFAVDPQRSIVRDEQSLWAWVNDERGGR